MAKQKTKDKRRCKKKLKHDSYEHAMIAMKKTMKKSFIFHRMRPYKCSVCGRWHIGRTKDIDYRKFKKLKR